MNAIDIEELSNLRKIKNLYQEILLKMDLEYFFSKEAEVEELFQRVYLTQRNTPSSAERIELLKDIHLMNSRITEFVQIKKNRLENQGKLVEQYSSSYGSIFFDKKG
ncbi:hypothetical protein [Paenibacillus sp. sgz5001063]|uniref:hypothetical protein n=1 Tax=Paenibacillus sp. sgz5001063 TaxID=3242474 RepID=UPI0036D42812